METVGVEPALRCGRDHRPLPPRVLVASGPLTRWSVGALVPLAVALTHVAIGALVAGMLETCWRKGHTLVVLAVSTGVVVIVVAVAVVLVVLLVTVSMRSRQKRSAQQLGEARQAGRAERDREIARQGEQDLGPDG